MAFTPGTTVPTDTIPVAPAQGPASADAQLTFTVGVGLAHNTFTLTSAIAGAVNTSNAKTAIVEIILLHIL